jgi:hypothetical protein
MFELLLVSLALGALALAALAPWPLLLETGAALAGAGMLVGVPAGLLYHLRLRRALLDADALSARWWVSPVPLHRRLDAGALAPVLPPFYLGAAGFLLTVLGCAVVLLGVLGSLLDPP